MDQTLTAHLVYATETGAVIRVQWGLLSVAMVVLLAAVYLIFTLRLRTHEQAKEVLRLAVEVQDLQTEVETQRERRRKATSDLAAYHKRVEPLIVQVEAMKTATNDIERASAFREAGRLVKLVPRERKKAA